MTDGDYLLVHIGDPIEIFPFFPFFFSLSHPIPSCFLFRSLIRRDNVVLIQTQYTRTYSRTVPTAITISHTSILYPASLLVFSRLLPSLIYPVLS